MYMLEYGFIYARNICGVRKGVGSPKAEVTGCCEPPQLDVGNWTQNPCKSTTPLTEQFLVCHAWRGHRSTLAVFLNHTPLYFLRWSLLLSLGLLPIRLDCSAGKSYLTPTLDSIQDCTQLSVVATCMRVHVELREPLWEAGFLFSPLYMLCSNFLKDTTFCLRGKLRKCQMF